MMNEDRDFELAVVFNNNGIIMIEELSSLKFEDVKSESTQKFKKHPVTLQGAISLYDCINWFSQEETLTGNDKWYCSNCKNH